MKRTMLALLLGIALGVVGTLVSVEIAGGWYTYEIWPEARCRSGGLVIGVPEPVTSSGIPCMFKRPRWSFIN